MRTIIAIIAIAIITIIAVLSGINGQLLTSGVGVIAGLGAYHAYHERKSKATIPPPTTRPRL